METASPAAASRARLTAGGAGWRHVFCQLPLTSPKFLVLALAHSAEFVREHGWRAGQTIAVDLEEIQYRGPVFIMLIRESAVPAEGEGDLLMVVGHRDLDDRGVMLYGKGPVAAEVMRRRTEQTREIELVMHKPDGTRTDIMLVRHVDWVAAHQAEAGREIFLDLADMGARGFARVVAVRACPPLPVPEKYRPGARMVTGTFRHSSGDVYDLKVAAEARPLGVTGTHPFWSVDRRGWVSAAQLRPGERLKTLRGTTYVESLTKRPHPEPVCNIEVEGEHVYRVGESGVLVHNASAGCDPECKPGPNQLPDCDASDPETDPNEVAREWLRDRCPYSLMLTLDPCVETAATTAIATCKEALPGGKRYTGTPNACDVKPHVVISGSSTNISVHVTSCDCCSAGRKTTECLRPHWGSDRTTGRQGVYPGCDRV